MLVLLPHCVFCDRFCFFDLQWLDNSLVCLGHMEKVAAFTLQAFILIEESTPFLRLFVDFIANCSEILTLRERCYHRGHFLLARMVVVALVTVAARIFQEMSTDFLFLCLALSKCHLLSFLVFACLWFALAFIFQSLSSFCGLLSLRSVWTFLALLLALRVLAGCESRLLGLLSERGILLLWLLYGLVL